MTCLDVLPDCPDCLAEEPFSRGGEHRCDDFCAFFGEQKRDDPEFHRRSHEPQTCGHCGVMLDDHRGTVRTVTGRCESGTCRLWLCPDCGGVVSGDGPLGCPVCSPIEGEAA